MDLSINHVLDFHNQMDWLETDPQIICNSLSIKADYWERDYQKISANRDTKPRLISVRPVTGKNDGPIETRYGASVVFPDGVFGRLAMGIPFGKASAENDRIWNRLTISSDGYNLVLQDLNFCEPSSSLYESCLSKSNSFRGSGSWSQPIYIGK